MISVLYFLNMFFIVTASVGATFFVLLFAFSEWEKSIVGRAMMTLAVALALALDCTLMFRIWQTDNLVIVRSVYLVVFMALTAGTWFMTYKMWKHNHLLPKQRRKQGSREQRND